MQGERWHELRNILVVRPDNIGDVVLAAPVLKALRAAAPGARITLLASPAGSAAAPLLRPWLDRVFVRRVLWQDVHGRLPHDAEHELELVGEIAARGFDAAFFLTSFSQSPLPPAYVCYLAGVPI
ncbi:MAG: glycosyltransferase family 9 protein, partial [Thermoleophilia bacterium]|nr:glycosyltransferase family 9 protein [Thermoleophilia bacterium]